MSPNQSLTTRPAAPDDADFLYQIYAASRQEEISAWGWPAPQQESFLKMQFRARSQSYSAAHPGLLTSIFLCNGEPSGCATVSHEPNQIRLVDIAFLPEFRNRGLGTLWILQLLRVAMAAGLPVRLSVTHGNPAARLYQRLGFAPTGDTGIYLEMEFHISRRPVSDSDHPLLFALYASTRDAELAMTPWTVEQKHAFTSMQFQAQISGYAQAYPEAFHEIILSGHAPVGRIYWAREAKRLHILDITIVPAMRSRGVGSAVLRELIEEADRAGKTVSIYLESFNPSLRLFERLGFRIIEQDGFQLLLQLSPRSLKA